MEGTELKIDLKQLRLVARDKCLVIRTNSHYQCEMFALQVEKQGLPFLGCTEKLPLSDLYNLRAVNAVIVTSCNIQGQARILGGAKVTNIDSVLTGQSVIDTSSLESILGNRGFREAIEPLAQPLINGVDEAWALLASQLTSRSIKDGREVTSKFRCLIGEDNRRGLDWLKNLDQRLTSFILKSRFNITEKQMKKWLHIFSDSSILPQLDASQLFDALLKSGPSEFVAFSSAQLDCLVFVYQEQDTESLMVLSLTQETGSLIDAARLSHLVDNSQNAYAFHAASYRRTIRNILEQGRLPVSVKWNELSKAGSFLEVSDLLDAYYHAAKPINSELERKSVTDDKLSKLPDHTQLLSVIDHALASKQYVLFIMDGLSFFDFLMVFDEDLLNEYRVNIYSDLLFVQSILPTITGTNLSAIFLSSPSLNETNPLRGKALQIEERLDCKLLNVVDGPWQICSHGERGINKYLGQAVEALKQGVRFAALYDVSFELNARDKALPDYGRLSLDLRRLITLALKKKINLVITSDHGWIRTRPLTNGHLGFQAKSHHRCSKPLPAEESSFDKYSYILRIQDQSIRILRGAYHPSRVPRYSHGGCSIQEILVPVMVIRGK